MDSTLLVAIALLAGVVIALGAALVTVTVRAALGLGAAALLALAAPTLALFAMVGVATATVVDALLGRAAPRVERRAPAVLSRGVASALVVEAEGSSAFALRVRQPLVPDIEV